MFLLPSPLTPFLVDFDVDLFRLLDHLFRSFDFLAALLEFNA
jgi:hypothetical protein